MKIKSHGVDVELSVGDQAAFLLGGVAGFVMDAYFLFGVTGGECAATGASAALGGKRIFEAFFRDSDKNDALLSRSARLRDLLAEEKREDLLHSLDRYDQLFRAGLIQPDEFEAVLQSTAEDFAEKGKSIS